METEDERRARLENDAATNAAQVSHGERKARLVKMVAFTQLRLALEAEDERRKWNELYLYFICVCLSMEEALFRITITSANFLQKLVGLRFCLAMQI